MPLRLLWLSLRLLLPLALVLGSFSLVALPLVDDLTQRWFVRDLDSRSQMLASTLQAPLLVLVAAQDRAGITGLFDRAVADGKLKAAWFRRHFSVMDRQTLRCA